MQMRRLLQAAVLDGKAQQHKKDHNTADEWDAVSEVLAINGMQSRAVKVQQAKVARKLEGYHAKSEEFDSAPQEEQIEALQALEALNTVNMKKTSKVFMEDIKDIMSLFAAAVKADKASKNESSHDSELESDLEDQYRSESPSPKM